MLDANLKTQLKAYLEKVSQPFEIVASLDDSDKSRELLGLLQDIVGLTDKITLKTDGSDARKPSFSLNRPGADIGLRFAGIPMGHEFTSLVLALLQVGGHPSKLDADVIEQVKGIEGTFEFETYFSLSCQNCPDVVQALNLMAVLNPNIRHVAIDARCSRMRSRRARSCRCRASTSTAKSSARAAWAWKRSSPRSTPAPPPATPRS